GNTIILLNTTTHTCTTETYSGGPAKVFNGTYGRFRYSQNKGVFVSCNSIDSNCYTLRIDAPEDTDFYNRCNAVGVARCVGFDNPNTDIVQGQNVSPGDYGYTNIGLDTSMKRSGAGSLRLTQLAGQSGSQISGVWSPLPGTAMQPALGQTWGQNST